MVSYSNQQSIIVELFLTCLMLSVLPLLGYSAFCYIAPLFTGSKKQTTSQGYIPALTVHGSRNKCPSEMLFVHSPHQG